ncbi:hypothetical protein CENTIMANUS_00316 [Klebsiella phage vB_KpM_Centimanus]
MNYSKGQNDSIVKDFQAGKFYLFKANVSYSPFPKFTLSCEPTTPNPELEYSWSVPKFISGAIDQVCIDIVIKDGTVTHFTRPVLPDNDRYSIHFDIRFEWQKKGYVGVASEKELIEKLNRLITSYMSRSHVINPVEEIEAIFTFVDNSLSNKQETKMKDIVATLEDLNAPHLAVTSALTNYRRSKDNNVSPIAYSITFDDARDVIGSSAVRKDVELSFGEDGSLYAEYSVERIGGNRDKVILSICFPPVKPPNDTIFNKMINKLPQLIGHFIRKLNSGASDQVQQVSLSTLTRALVSLIKEKMVSVPKLDLSFTEQTLRHYVKDWDDGKSVSHAVGWNRKDIFAATYCAKITLSELSNTQVDIALDTLKERIPAMKESKPAQIFHISPEYTKYGFTFTFSYYYGD